MTDKELNAKIVDLFQQQIRKLVSFKITCPYCRNKYTIDEVSNCGDEKPEDKETLELYTTRCTSCGKVSPIGDYCIWCGEKDTCLEGGDKL